jgi:hypothetical protein
MSENDILVMSSALARTVMAKQKPKYGTCDVNFHQLANRTE